jgi:general secretion pathway protein K
MRASDPRRGIVLVVVLWTIALLAGLAMAASTTFRSFAGIVGVDRDRIRADALLTAGLETAAGFLAVTSDQAAVDDVETGVTLPAGTVRARLRDEGGRIDIGKAPVEVLVSLLNFVGAPSAQEMARDIAEWRDPGATSRQSDTSQLPPQGADNPVAPFTDVRLLRRVSGIGPKLVGALAPLTTVFGSETVNPMTASANVLAALPGMDRERVAAIIDTRQRFPTDPARLQAILGPVQKYAQVKPQRAVSVALAAKLADGYSAAAQAVIIRLPDDGEPYRVLQWSPLPRS